MRKLTDTQVKVLGEVYSSDSPLTLSGRKRRTVEVLTKAGLVTYTFIKNERGSSDLLLVHRKAKTEKVQDIITNHLEEERGRRGL